MKSESNLVINKLETSWDRVAVSFGNCRVNCQHSSSYILFHYRI